MVTTHYVLGGVVLDVDGHLKHLLNIFRRGARSDPGWGGESILPVAMLASGFLELGLISSRTLGIFKSRMLRLRSSNPDRSFEIRRRGHLYRLENSSPQAGSLLVRVIRATTITESEAAILLQYGIDTTPMSLLPLYARALRGTGPSLFEAPSKLWPGIIRQSKCRICGAQLAVYVTSAVCAGCFKASKFLLPTP